MSPKFFPQAAQEILKMVKMRTFPKNRSAIAAAPEMIEMVARSTFKLFLYLMLGDIDERTVAFNATVERIDARKDIEMPHYFLHLFLRVLTTHPIAMRNGFYL